MSVKRLTLRAALYAFFGVFVSLVLAWGIALLRPYEGLPVGPLTVAPDQSGESWVVVQSQRPGVGALQWCGKRERFSDDNDFQTGEFPHWSGFRFDPWEDRQAAGPNYLEVACGWPAYCLQMGFGEKLTPTGLSHVYFMEWSTAIEHHGLRIPMSRQGPPIALPLQPVYSGLAIDALFWGVACLAVHLIVRQARRSLRTHRGLCPNCGYNLTGNVSGRCPECGEIAWAGGNLPDDAIQAARGGRLTVRTKR